MKIVLTIPSVFSMRLKFFSTFVLRWSSEENSWKKIINNIGFLLISGRFWRLFRWWQTLDSAGQFRHRWNRFVLRFYSFSTCFAEFSNRSEINVSSYLLQTVSAQFFLRHVAVWTIFASLLSIWFIYFWWAGMDISDSCYNWQNSWRYGSWL